MRRLQRPRAAGRHARRWPIVSGCATLATGHYARTAESDDARGPLLRAAADAAKDQTYMLAALTPESLARMRFPLGELRKPQVRRIAARRGLPVASKADSQDLCFLAGTSRARFMERHGGDREPPGEIVDSGGAVLGRHDGQHRFTVGQRRGIGIHATEPLYVLHKDAASGRVTVGTRERAAHRPCAHPRGAPAPRRRAASTASSCATASARSAPASPVTPPRAGTAPCR